MSIKADQREPDAFFVLSGAHRRRRELVEQPIRDALEQIGYGFREFCAEMERRCWVVALSTDCIRVFTHEPFPSERAASGGMNIGTAPRGECIAQWQDHMGGNGYTVDHIARCLRAEMEATGVLMVHAPWWSRIQEADRVA